MKTILALILSVAAFAAVYGADKPVEVKTLIEDMENLDKMVLSLNKTITEFMSGNKNVTSAEEHKKLQEHLTKLLTTDSQELMKTLDEFVVYSGFDPLCANKTQEKTQ